MKALFEGNLPPHDKQFLRQFLTKERVMQLADDDIEKLHQASEMGDAYAQYAYGRWLYLYNPYDGALADAEKLFFASKDIVPDSLAVYAQMLRYGETEITHPSAIDIEKSQQMTEEAISRGSELGALNWARHHIFGNFCQAEPAQIAEEIEQRLRNHPDSDPSWYNMLAYAYEELDRQDDAIQSYEKAIAQGELNAYSNLAFLYMKRGNMALYEEYMEEGLEKRAGGCYIYQADINDEDFDELPEAEQQQLHQTIDERLRLGLKKGEGLCAYYLWLHNYYGGLGYTEDTTMAFSYLKRGVQLTCTACITQMAMEVQDYGIPGQTITATDKAELWLKAARYAPYNEEALYYLQHVNDPAFLLKHKEELERYWQPLFPQEPISPESSTIDSKPWTPIDPSDIIKDDDDGRYDAWA